MRLTAGGGGSGSSSSAIADGRLARDTYFTTLNRVVKHMVS